MSQLSLKKGRIGQKIKTRSAILKAAKALMKSKEELSMENIASKAGISRATIYRYFTDLELLILEASLDVNFKDPGEISDSVSGLELEEKLHGIMEYFVKLTQQHEVLFRQYLSAVLKVSVNSKERIRGARRVKAIEQALDEKQVRLKQEDKEKLIHISTLLMGIESLVVAKDVCGLNNRQSADLFTWALDMILKGMQVSGK